VTNPADFFYKCYILKALFFDNAMNAFFETEIAVGIF